MKLIVDMNLSPRWVSYLGGYDFEAVHWSTVGRINALDTEIMAYAASKDLIVLTHDLDFSAILAATGGTKPSVVQIRSDNLSTDAIGMLLVTSLRQMEGELKAGALLTVDANRTRLNLLPLRTKNSE